MGLTASFTKGKGEKYPGSYTPEAPAPAVAELTIGLIRSLLRMVNVSNLELHQGRDDFLA